MHKMPFDNSGFTFMGVLALVTVMGFAMAGASYSWTTIRIRAKEESLLYCGDQFKRAIASYYNSTPANKKEAYPKRLEDLLKDPRVSATRRHLRKIYPEPMGPNAKWKLIYTPKKGIKGVHSTSDMAPLKRANFPKGYESFEKATTYADWKFVFEPKTKSKQKPQQAQKKAQTL